MNPIRNSSALSGLSDAAKEPMTVMSLNVIVIINQDRLQNKQDFFIQRFHVCDTVIMKATGCTLCSSTADQATKEIETFLGTNT